MIERFAGEARKSAGKSFFFFPRQAEIILRPMGMIFCHFYFEIF